MFLESDDLTLGDAIELLADARSGANDLDLAIFQAIRRHAISVPVWWLSAFTRDVRKAKKLIPSGWALCSSASYPLWCSAHFVRKDLSAVFPAEYRPQEVAARTRSYMGNTEALAVCIGALDLTRQLVGEHEAQACEGRPMELHARLSVSR